LILESQNGRAHSIQLDGYETVINHGTTAIIEEEKIAGEKNFLAFYFR